MDEHIEGPPQTFDLRYAVAGYRRLTPDALRDAISNLADRILERLGPKSKADKAKLDVVLRFPYEKQGLEFFEDAGIVTECEVQKPIESKIGLTRFAEITLYRSALETFKKNLRRQRPFRSSKNRKKAPILQRSTDYKLIIYRGRRHTLNDQQATVFKIVEKYAKKNPTNPYVDQRDVLSRVESDLRPGRTLQAIFKRKIKVWKILLKHAPDSNRRITLRYMPTVLPLPSKN